MGVTFTGLTTGPFIVPGRVTGDPTAVSPDNFFIVVKNPTTTPLQIRFFLDVCLEPETMKVEHFSTDMITIDADSCFTSPGPVNFPLAPRFVVRVSMIGDIRTKGELLEAEVVGFRTFDLMNEPTMFFRHHDLIPTNNIFVPEGLPVPSSSNSLWKKHSRTG
ncbi:hypothetical protein V7127_00110 [Bacillus sp. JJ1773]|uniref:hypothetical protein n=1 Tax=Bacillus sp. JJ1773 TaxID=3122965 RepID=UPI0030006653